MELIDLLKSQIHDFIELRGYRNKIEVETAVLNGIILDYEKMLNHIKNNETAVHSSEEQSKYTLRA